MMTSAPKLLQQLAMLSSSVVTTEGGEGERGGRETGWDKGCGMGSREGGRDLQVERVTNELCS